MPTTITITKHTIRARRSELEKRMSAKTSPVKLSDLARELFQVVICPYLNRAWFILMPARVYTNRVNTIDEFFNAIEVSIKTNTDDGLIKAIHSANQSMVKPRRLQKLLDQVLLKAAKGEMSIKTRNVKGDVVVIKEGLYGLSACLSKRIDVLQVELAQVSTLVPQEKRALLKRISDLEKDLGHQEALLERYEKIIKQYKEKLKTLKLTTDDASEMTELTDLSVSSASSSENDSSDESAESATSSVMLSPRLTISGDSNS